MAVANLDWNATSKDTVALKYFYQHDPTLSPYSFSNVPGFTEHLDSGVAGGGDQQHVSGQVEPEHDGEHRHSAREDLAGQRAAVGAGAIYAQRLQQEPAVINTFGSSYFPGVSIFNVLGDDYVRS